MHYISTKPLTLPKPMAFGEDGKSEDSQGVTLAHVLKVILEGYQPTRTFSLNIKQLRSLNKCLDVFEESAEGGYYVVDNEEWELLKLLVESYAPTIFLSHVRNLPAILDALAASPDKKPVVEAPAPDDEKQKALVG